MSWWHRLLHRGRMEERLDKELRFHIEQRTADLIDCGYDPAKARRRARIEIGGLEQTKEQCRDQRRNRWLDAVHQLFQRKLHRAGHASTLAAGAFKICVPRWA